MTLAQKHPKRWRFVRNALYVAAVSHLPLLSGIVIQQPIVVLTFTAVVVMCSLAAIGVTGWSVWEDCQ